MKSDLVDTFSTMNWMVLAVLFFVSTCVTEENASGKRRNMVEEIEDNIRWLRQAKEQVEREERRKNSLAALTDVIIKDSFDSQLMSKMDILYDNQTDLSKELKFVPQVFNCGKEFDIFKVLELAKAHKNITTEQPPCIMDEEDDMCSTKKSNGMANNNKGTKTSPQTPGVVRAFALQSVISTRLPSVPPPYGRKTELAFMRQSTINPLTKTGKSENREKPSPIGKEAGRKTSPSHLQKHSDSKGFVTNPPLIYRKFSAVPSLGDVQMEENPPISEDQPQSWYAPEVAQYEQYPSIENQNENDIQVKLQEPQENRQKLVPGSLKEQIKGAKIVQTIQQQSQVVGQTAPSQVVEHPHVQNVAMGEMIHQKQPGNQAGQKDKKAAPSVVIDDKKKETGGIIQAQQPPQQSVKINKQSPGQKLFTQPQFSEQKHFNKQSSEKQIQQQPQTLDFQNQQQQQTIEQPNQQTFQTLERSGQQQTETLEKQSTQQFLTAEQQKQLHSQTAEQQKQLHSQAAEQQLQTGQQQKQHPFQISEQQKELQLQTAEQQKQQPLQTNEQNQFQTMERHYTQLRTSEKYGQPQFQIIEKQSPVITPVTLSERQQPPGPEQQQVIPKTSQSIYDQQQILYPQRIQQNQQADKPLTNPITSAQQAPQVPEPLSVAKLPSIAPNRAVSESSSEKLLNSNFDKNMMPAPINVIVMEPNLDFPYGTPTSKGNLITENIPAKSYFWDYTIANTPKVQNYDSLKTEQNKAASVANQRSSDIPGSLQENSRGDYLYYQDQD